jgi:hypothetical protein
MCSTSAFGRMPPAVPNLRTSAAGLRGNSRNYSPAPPATKPGHRHFALAANPSSYRWIPSIIDLIVNTSPHDGGGARRHSPCVHDGVETAFTISGIGTDGLQESSKIQCGF